MVELSDHLKGVIETLPIKPGCYIMKNSAGEVIYVGKAINLRNRVRSYFQEHPETDRKVIKLVSQIEDLEWIVVGSELEALILEMNLIKKYRPRFNVRLKDDKRYPYIKVHLATPFPKVTVTRQMVNDGSRYFGPYTSVWAVHQTLDLLRHIFPYLTCDREITGHDARPCLYYDIKLCSGPCIGAIDQAGYTRLIEDLCAFLDGQTDPIVSRLQQEMTLAAEQLNYEKAAQLRDQLQSIERVVEKQKVITSEEGNSDVLALARADNEACIQVFFIRNGRLMGREYFVMEGAEETPDNEVMAEFIKQFYTEAAVIPDKVLLPNEVEEAQIIRQWLNTRRGGSKVELSVPRSGTAQELVAMATENAVETLQALRTQWEADKNKQTQALAEIQQALGLPQAPNRIECFDISNTQGTASVGSMVVFEQGTPSRNLYRHFNIKTVSGPDDFASMEEVLSRRFKRWQAAQEKQQVGVKPDPSFAVLPDLLIVDGGKGQLGRAVNVLRSFNLDGTVQVVGLAKQQEELFQPEREASVILPRRSQGLYLVQRIRDEAHRFAITAHRKARGKIGIASRLDAIPGIGPARRKALLQKFGDIEAIRQATLDELLTVSGINEEIARAIQSGLD
ncbi:MAG TPA: excinuclease ABC subunit UvrC [Anaerolineaceae bacterium]|nr:excinuclease ABC subunit UvrC [Anaerolineaceae bacterium]